MADRLRELEQQSGLLTYEEVRLVACEECGAESGEKCRRGWNARTDLPRHMNAVHAGRYRAAARARADNGS